MQTQVNLSNFKHTQYFNNDPILSCQQDRLPKFKKKRGREGSLPCFGGGFSEVVARP